MPPQLRFAALFPLAISFAQGARRLELVAESIGGIEHPGLPFTQGLTALVQPSCKPLGAQLDTCLTDHVYSKRATCYDRVLEGCVALYESSGEYGRSYVRRVTDFTSGEADMRVNAPANVFNEGMDFVDEENKLLLLGSWREHRLTFIRDTGSHLEIVSNVQWNGLKEHWGICPNKEPGTMWMTDGGRELYLVDVSQALPNMQGRRQSSPTVSILSSVTLQCFGQSVRRANELSYDAERDTIWANIWLSTNLYEFNHTTGKCVSTLNLESDKRLKMAVAEGSHDNDPNKVWNGIHMLGGNWILFTGKRFPFIFIAKYKVMSG